MTLLALVLTGVLIWTLDGLRGRFATIRAADGKEVKMVEHGEGL